MFRIVLVLALSLCSALAIPVLGQDSGGAPQRVLVTNDNGIDDPKLLALAQAFATVAETWVVAPAEDQSGASTFLELPRTGSTTVTERDFGPGIRAYAVDGFPGDAVLVALQGLMAGKRPDLVVSGINGGANEAGGWMFSGTVGAARVAAIAGYPAVAVSGLLDDELAGAKEAAAEWVVRLARSALVRDLEPLEYLTVSFPPAITDVRGVRITDRAPLLAIPRVASETPGEWRIVGTDSTTFPRPRSTDVRAMQSGYIAVVPMKADEVDVVRLRALRRAGADTMLPPWEW